MTDIKLLNDKLNNSGLRKQFVADKLGITRQGLDNKLNGKSDFKSEEMAVLCDILHITSLREKDRIFFARKVEQ